MGTSYIEKLRDPRWQKKRLEALEAADWACQKCGNSEETLHVHHKQYFKGRDPWEYDVDQLAVLCATCHSEEHEIEDALLVAASRAPIDGPGSRDECAMLLYGLLGFEAEFRYPAEEFFYLFGQVVASVGWGDASQTRRLREDLDRGKDSEILATIRRVMGDRTAHFVARIDGGRQDA